MKKILSFLVANIFNIFFLVAFVCVFMFILKINQKLDIIENYSDRTMDYCSEASDNAQNASSSCSDAEDYCSEASDNAQNASSSCSDAEDYCSYMNF